MIIILMKKMKVNNLISLLRKALINYQKNCKKKLLTANKIGNLFFCFILNYFFREKSEESLLMLMENVVDKMKGELAEYMEL